VMIDRYILRVCQERKICMERIRVLYNDIISFSQNKLIIPNLKDGDISSINELSIFENGFEWKGVRDEDDKKKKKSATSSRVDSHFMSDIWRKWLDAL
jgi:hypothetical protein